ncbi:MAG: FRG domain-containing protein [Bacillota bacterium]
MPVFEKTINTFSEYIAYIEELGSTLSRPLWFRGCGKKSYKLLPSLFRHKSTSNIENFMKLEASLLDRFQQRSIPFSSRQMKDNWEWLFFMQHHGIPTRLLDWTESPLAALFFAVTNPTHNLNDEGNITFRSDAAVWVLDPEAWNKKSVDLESFTGKVLTTNDSNLSAYSPISECSMMKQYPLAIYGSHNSQRIVAQRGVFVVFGKAIDSMEAIYNRGFPERCLIRIILPRASLAGIMASINRNGITDSVIFPDLDGLAREIKREFNFEV